MFLGLVLRDMMLYGDFTRVNGLKERYEKLGETVWRELNKKYPNVLENRKKRIISKALKDYT